MASETASQQRAMAGRLAGQWDAAVDSALSEQNVA
jgi:hypothetical protein